MKILVTGANGFIGKYCIPLLTGKGYEVHAITRDRRELPKDHVVWHRVDLHSNEEIESLIERIRPEKLLHLAWYTEHGKFWNSLENVTWLRTSTLLFQKFIEFGGKRIVASGTCAEYAWETDGALVEDESKIAPATFYGKIKDVTRQVLFLLSERTDTSYAWGRIFFPYGPGDSDARIIPSAMKSLLLGTKFYCKHSQIYRDFIYVEDVAAAFVSLLESDISGEFNIGSGVRVKLSDVMDMIGEITGRRDLIVNQENEISDAKSIQSSVDKIAADMFWSPKVELKQGLKNTFKFIKEKYE